MIKAILKRIFPIKILKNAFLIFNKIKIKTWDKLFFPEKFIPRENYLILEETNPFLNYQVPTGHLKQAVVDKLHLWLDPAWTQDQYLLYLKEAAFIEPAYGWAITTDHRLIYPSLGFSRAPHVNKPDLLDSYVKKNVVHLPRVISLRDTGEENYFHFYNDVLAKLFFIADQNFNLADFTIVVADKLFRKEFFQFFWTSPRLKNLRWHIQKDEWIHFEEAIFCKPYTHTKKYFDLAINLGPPIPSNDKADRRIFLTRPKSSLRFIENMDDLTPMLMSHQFEIVDTSNMKVAEQIELFSMCRYLISIHGAGLTNMIYRHRNPMTILEIIQPSAYIPFHYITLAHQYNYGYDIILGEKGNLHNQGGFRVNPAHFSINLEAMMKVQ